MSCEENSTDLCLVRGKTFSMTFRWAAEPYVYKSITGIANTAPVSLTVPGHGMPDGWQFAVSAAEGLTSLNALYDPPVEEDYHTGTVVDADTIEINSVNGMLLDTYTSGGAIQYLTPVDLAGMSARMQIRDHATGTLLLELTSADGDITLDADAHTITLDIPPTATEGETWNRAVYDLEMVSGADVMLLASGKVTVAEEVTVSG